MANRHPPRKTRDQILATMIFSSVGEIHAIDSMTGDAVAVLIGMLGADDQLGLVQWPEENIIGFIPYPKSARMPKTERILGLYGQAMRKKYPERLWL